MHAFYKCIYIFHHDCIRPEMSPQFLTVPLRSLVRPLWIFSSGHSQKLPILHLLSQFPVCLFQDPVTFSSCWSCWVDFPTKTLHTTSWKTASIPSLHSTVSSAMITVLAEMDHRTMSGYKEVGGDLSCWSRSTLMCHLHPGVSNEHSLWLMLVDGWCALAPCLAKRMCSLEDDGLVLFDSSLCSSKTSASFL